MKSALRQVKQTNISIVKLGFQKFNGLNVLLGGEECSGMV